MANLRIFYFSMFRNGGHLGGSSPNQIELRIGTMHARTIPVMFGKYWLSSFTAEALGAVMVVIIW